MTSSIISGLAYYTLQYLLRGQIFQPQNEYLFKFGLICLQTYIDKFKSPPQFAKVCFLEWGPVPQPQLV